MRDILNELNNWLQSDEIIGLATVIRTWGSAPRGVGAKMAFTLTGQIAGSVSGGCVEGAVIETGMRSIEQNVPQLIQFGVADETAWDVGLACGGTIEIFIERVDPIVLRFLADLYDADQPFASTTVIQGPRSLLGKKLVVQRGGRLFGGIDTQLDGVIAAAARSSLSVKESGVHRLELPELASEPIDIFVEVQHQAHQLIMVGGVHIAIALTNIAKTLGFQTVVIDPRRSFGSYDRFPHVDHLIQKWPEEAFQQISITPETAIASLTHDPKIDDPVMLVALNSPAFYVGALGSQKTHSERRKRLLLNGLSEERLDRIHGPIGLDIGAKNPEEIALSIMAEIISARR